jgi:hypothetical protein
MRRAFVRAFGQPIQALRRTAKFGLRYLEPAGPAALPSDLAPFR